MDSRRSALIKQIRHWAATQDDLMFVTVIDCYSIALFRQDLPGTDEALSRLLDERLAARPVRRPESQTTEGTL